MARRSPWTASVQRTLKALRRGATRVVVSATKQALKASLPKPAVARKRKPSPKKPAATTTTRWLEGLAITSTGARAYRVFKPPGSRARLPLFVLLHGCSQDAAAIARVTCIAALAAREGFIVLCPQQDRFANPQGCWNWYEQRTGRALAEAASILEVIDQVGALHGSDRRRVVVAGLSAGASMAAMLGSHHPDRFAAVAMHSGIAPTAAQSSATALRAMQGRSTPRPLNAGVALPPLLVIQGAADGVVAARNGLLAAHWWAAAMGASRGAERAVQRGKRRAATVTDFRVGSRRVVTLCEIAGLAHAWSGGAGLAFSDPAGPDATRMIWAFAKAAIRGRAAIEV